MKKRIETFYKLNKQEKQILTERYQKLDSNDDFTESMDIVKSTPSNREIQRAEPFSENAKLVVSPDSFMYDGSEKKPNVTVTNKNVTLEADHYDIVYKSNKNAGTGVVIVTGKNGYSGSLTGNFEISSKPISNASMTITPLSFIYDKKEKKPDVTVKDGDKLLTYDDYDITYSSNTDVGTGIVTVTGKGNYTGTLSATFEIRPRSHTLVWIFAALIVIVAVGCGIIFRSGGSSPVDNVSDSASSQISTVSRQSDISIVSSKTVSDESENSVKASSRESSVESSESSDESVSETSVNSHEISMESSDSTEETHQPSVERSEPSVIPEQSVYVPSQQSSKNVLESSEESSKVTSAGAPTSSIISEPSNPLITGTCGSNLKYTFNTNNHTLTITGNGDMSSGFYNFREKSDIQTVLIGSNVTSICDNAFDSCHNLKVVKMSDDIVEIGSNVFLNCTALKEINLSSNLKYLGDGAFCYCTSLEKITVPEKVSEIYNETFKGCTKLKEVHLSQNITEIDDTAFTGCDKTLTIYAPKGSYAETYANKHNIQLALVGFVIPEVQDNPNPDPSIPIS